MIDAGDICIVDLNHERRGRALVVSGARFHQLAGRVLVAPDVGGAPDEVPPPWRAQVDDGIYAVDLLRSIPVDRVLERIDRAPASTVAAVRRALRQIA